MERTPPEVLAMIIHTVAGCKILGHESYAARVDLMSLRQVNKRLSASITPRVFHTVPLWISVTSLQNLTRISEHSTIAKYVNVITFSVVQIKRPSDLAEAQVSLKEEFDRRFNSINDSTLAVSQYMGATARFVAEQENMYMNDKAKWILVGALRRFPCLQSFLVTIGSRWIGAKAITRAFGQLRGSEVCHDIIKALPVAFDALVASDVKLKDLTLDCKTSTRYLFPIVSRKPIQAPRPYGNLVTHAEENARVLVTSGSMAAAMHTMRLHSTSPYLSNLHVLSMVLPQTEGRQYLEFCTSFYKALRHCNGLLHLGVFGYEINNEHTYFSGDITAKEAQQYLSNLTTLRLAYHKIKTSRDFLNFFQSHSGKLKSVYFFHVDIADVYLKTGWDSAIVQMREWDWKVLQSWKLTSSRSTETEYDIAPYLKADTDCVPFAEEDDKK